MHTLSRNTTRKIQQKKTTVNSIQFDKTTMIEHKESYASLCINYYGIFLRLKERYQPQGHKNDTLWKEDFLLLKRKPLHRTNFAKLPIQFFFL